MLVLLGVDLLKLMVPVLGAELSILVVAYVFD